MNRKYLTFAALFALALSARADFYWLAVGIKSAAGQNTNGGAGNYLILTNDDPSVTYTPVKLYDVRRTENGGTAFKKYNGCNSVAPYDGCEYGGADYDLTLPIKEGDTACSLVDIGWEAFKGNSYIGSIKLPDTLVALEGRAFWQCYYLTKFTWPSDTTNLTVGERLFDTCSRLVGPIEWPEKFVNVNRSFTSCSVLTGFCGLGVTNVTDYAFQNCNALTMIEFGDSESITFGLQVFQGDKALKTVLFHNATPVINANITGVNGNSVLDWWGSAGATVYVPFNDAGDGPTDSWATFKTDFEAAYSGNAITWPTSNGDGTWADGSIYNAKVKKTVKLRFWDPDDTSTAALLAY